MLRSLILLAGYLAPLGVAVPLEKRNDFAAPPGGDYDILNYALTLEFLERKFYQEGLANFTSQDFANAGFTPEFYTNLQMVYKDEQTHVNFLSTALGSKAVPEPSFAFPVKDAKSFVSLASVLEGVGVSAYLGAAAAIADKSYLTDAGSILTVEARHASYIRAALGEKPFPNPFDTPLDFNQVFSMAAQFITDLKGAKLPFMAFPALTVKPDPTPATCGGTTLTFTNAYAAALKSGKVTKDTQVYAVFYSGLQIYYVKVGTNGCDYTAMIPGANYAMSGQPAPAGQTYIILSTADGKVMASDENTIAGVGNIEVVCSS